MPPSIPSRHRRFQSAHDVFIRSYTRRDEMVFEGLGGREIDQGFLAVSSTPTTDSATQKQSVASGHNSAAIIGLILVTSSLFLVIGISFFLIRYRKKLNDASLQATSSKDAAGPAIREKNGLLGTWIKSKKHGEPQFVLHQCQGGLVVSQSPPPSNLRSILKNSQEDLTQEKEPVRAVESFSNDYRIPSMAFNRSTASIPAPSPSANRSFDSNYGGPSDYLVHAHVNIFVSEDMSGSSSNDSSNFANTSRRSDFTITEYQRAQRTFSNTSDVDASSGPFTPDHHALEPQAQIMNQDVLIAKAEKQSRDFFSKLRDLIPAPPSPKLSSFTITPASGVRRSFTAPAFFTLDVAENKRSSVVSLKPGSTHERESVTSNFLLGLIEGQAKDERSLLEEGFPPPAIIVSPPTASTINSGINRRSLLAVDGDVWCQAYRVNVTSGERVTETPPEYHSELSKRRGGGVVPPRPARSPKRASVQSLVEG